jgi:hypothetical protein
MDETGSSAAPMTYAELSGAEIRTTIQKLQERISARFPGSGLGRISVDLGKLAESAEHEIERLRKPLWLARLGAISGILGIAVIAGGVGLAAISRPLDMGAVSEFLQGVEAAANGVILLVVGTFFMLTLETRIKRKAALKALYRLRSVIHVVDMHQLTKDPEFVAWPGMPVEQAREPVLTRFLMVRYLDYCSELFALASKVAALYSQYINDAVVVAAVNEIESLAATLAQKVWQKITILDQRRYEMDEPARADAGQRAAG